MKQRITYLLPTGTGVDPKDIELGNDEVKYAKRNDAAEERRITLGLSDLPKELQVFLEDFHELHVRVGSHNNYQAFSPAFARVPPGLHAFFTPRKSDQDTQLCSKLKYLLGETVKCTDSSSSFSRPPVLSKRFASSSTYQFYHAPLDILAVSAKLRFHICGGIKAGSGVGAVCEVLAETSAAAYVDYDFDAISHAVTIAIFRTPEKNPRKAHKLEPEARLEVGILSPEVAKEPEELSLGGFLTVVGEDDHPSATLFSFPSRHHPLPPGDETTYSIDFQQPTGLHPKLSITFPSEHLKPPKEDSCALHAYWTIPSSLFIDRYQLSDPLFLQSQNLVSLRAISGEQDLEAPDWAVTGWGSAALLELATPSEAESSGNWTVTVPTHLRYLNATALSSGHAQVSVPWPVVFWACRAEEGLKMATNPFDRVNLGYDGLFGPKTMFYHVPPTPEVDVLVSTLEVPVLDPTATTTKWVPLGTAVAVLLGFGWICWQLLKGSQAKPEEKVKKSQ